MVINRFVGPYRFLSNFWPAEVDLEGEIYPTVEHAYQAAKVPYAATYQVYLTNWGYGERRWRERIRKVGSASQARRIGKLASLPVRSYWEVSRMSVMRVLLKQKFAPGRPERAQLLETGDALLVEGNTWGDTFWGICGDEGENWLGRLLMEIREGVREPA